MICLRVYNSWDLGTVWWIDSSVSSVIEDQCFLGIMVSRFNGEQLEGSVSLELPTRAFTSDFTKL